MFVFCGRALGVDLGRNRWLYNGVIHWLHATLKVDVCIWGI
jgi:hypothetical protein